MDKAMNMLLDFGVKEGFLTEPKFVFVPEVMTLAPKLCPRVYKMVISAAPSPEACCAFCTYTAIGATYLWQNDIKRFQKEDILEILTKPRGEDCMDEYVTDLTGFNHKDLEDHLKIAAILAIGNTEDVAKRFDKCLETMFQYGMVLEMQKLGLS